MFFNTREKLAARYYKGAKHRRLLSLSHFNSQWLQYIRIVGCYPISYNRPTSWEVTGANYHFEFRLFSWATFYTVVILTVTLTCLLKWFVKLHSVDSLESLVMEYNSGTSEGIMLAALHNKTAFNNKTTATYNVDAMTRLCFESVTKLVPLSAIGYALVSTLSTPQFINFLNGVNDFENQIRQVFPEVVDISLAQLHLFRTWIIVVTNLIFIALTITQGPRVYAVIRHADNLLESQTFFTHFTLFFIGFLGVFDDTKALSILKMVEEYFQQIIDGIRKYHMKRSGATCIDDIKKLRKLVHTARKQAKLAVLSIQGSTITALTGLHIVLTTSIYLIYCLLYRDLPKFMEDYAFGSLLYCTVTFSRLLGKALLAESISKKENELAETLRLAGDCSNDTKFVSIAATRSASVAAQIEISFITDPILLKPTQCVMNGNITLRVALLMGIFQNVSTYAVALIQLSNVQNNLVSNETVVN